MPHAPPLSHLTPTPASQLNCPRFGVTGSAVRAFFIMMANIESSVSLEEENSNSLTLTTISEAKKLDANLSKPENAAIARKPKRTKILNS